MASVVSFCRNSLNTMVSEEGSAFYIPEACGNSDLSVSSSFCIRKFQSFEA